MLKLAGELIEGQLADHMADLDAHTRNVGEVLKTGVYIDPNIGVHAAVAVLANKLYAIPFWVPRAMTIDYIAIDVSALSGGHSCYLGIYNDGTNLYPGTLLIDAGEVSVNTNGLKAAACAKSLTKGLYWLAVASEGTPTVSYLSTRYPILGRLSTNLAVSYNGWKVAHVYAALPDPFTAGGSLVSDAPLVCPKLVSLD